MTRSSVTRVNLVTLNPPLTTNKNLFSSGVKTVSIFFAEDSKEEQDLRTKICCFFGNLSVDYFTRASQFAKSVRNLAPRGSFASFFKVIFRSGLLFLIGSGLGVPVFD